MAIAHWGDEYMVDRKGRPLLHTHSVCGHTFDPKMVCSECGEELQPRDVQVQPGPGATNPNHLPMALPKATDKRAKRVARAVEG